MLVRAALVSPVCYTVNAVSLFSQAWYAVTTLQKTFQVSTSSGVQHLAGMPQTRVQSHREPTIQPIRPRFVPLKRTDRSCLWCFVAGAMTMNFGFVCPFVAGVAFRSFRGNRVASFCHRRFVAGATTQNIPGWRPSISTWPFVPGVYANKRHSNCQK